MDFCAAFTIRSGEMQMGVTEQYLLPVQGINNYTEVKSLTCFDCFFQFSLL